MKQRSVTTSIASPLRLWPQRLLFVMAVLAGLAVAIAGKNDASLLSRTKLAILDFTAPIFTALSAPVVTARNTLADIRSYLSLRELNQQLREENTLLLQWRQVAHDLKTENDQLRKLTHFQAPPNVSYVTAPIVAETNHGLSRSAIILVGQEHLIEKGQAVLGELGIIGRVLDVGEKAARILLLTDINSRLPVMVGRSGSFAILSGTSQGFPELILVNEGADIRLGDVLFTSGSGGDVSAGLPVGKIIAMEEGRYKVRLYADLDQISYVRILNSGVKDLIDRELSNQDKGKANGRENTP